MTLTWTTKLLPRRRGRQVNVWYWVGTHADSEDFTGVK